MADIEIDDAFEEEVNTEDLIISKDKTKKRVFAYTRLSVSMMKTWLQCKRKFYESYIKGTKQAAQAHFTLGTAVHYALEMANTSLREEPRELHPVEIAAYMRLFVNMAAREFVPDPKLFAEGQEMVKHELHSPSLATEKIIGIEEEFNITTPEGVVIYGFIDKIIEKDPTTIRIIDYKTSKTAISYQESRTDFQLSMYDLAMSLKFPQYENIEVELRYLRTHESVVAKRSVEDRYVFRQILVEVDAAIKEFMSTVKAPPPGNINDFCAWCSFKNSCPEYVEMVNTILPSAPSTHDLTDDTFIETWKKVQTILKGAESWKDQLKIWAIERMNADPETKIQSDQEEMYHLTTTAKEYDLAVIGNLIPLEDLLGTKTGEPLVKINKKKLETYVANKGDRKLAQKVDKGSFVRVNSPQIRIRKANGKK